MSDAVLRLWSGSLLSKWGFNDGNEPDDFWDWREKQGEQDMDWHATLRLLVREHLLPKLQQRVKIVDIETSHNPVRAEMVDGVEIDWYKKYPDGTLTPEFVEVPYEEVLRIARGSAGQS